jgi:phosphonate transport system substrate-binding protein
VENTIHEKNHREERKLKKILLMAMAFVFLFTVTACGPKIEEEYPATLIVQFVPSTSFNASKLTLVKDLEVMLEEKLRDAGFDIHVYISVGTSYAAVIEAMTSGQVHVGFLTSQQYAFVTTEDPGKVEVILTSVRDAYQCQVANDGTVITDTATIIANANNDANYSAATSSAHQVNSYYSMLLIKTEDYADYQAQGIQWLAGKTIGTQSTTSGSGFVYPSFLLYQNDLTFVNTTPNAANGEVRYQTIGGHQNSVISLLNDEVDGVFTFFDARYGDTNYTTWQAANVGENRFALTRVAALTTPIFNDTISVVSTLGPQLKTALQEAFIEIIDTEKGAAALTIYNHTGYLVAHDEDYDDERALYQFLNP